MMMVSKELVPFKIILSQSLTYCKDKKWPA
jgi:hypothetical protein